jgi:hypothetical protein
MRQQLPVSPLSRHPRFHAALASPSRLYRANKSPNPRHADDDDAAVVARPKHWRCSSSTSSFNPSIFEETDHK